MKEEQEAHKVGLAVGSLGFIFAFFALMKSLGLLPALFWSVIIGVASYILVMAYFIIRLIRHWWKNK